MSAPMMVQPPVEEGEFRQRIGRLEGLLVSVEEFADPASRAKAREAIHGILELHAVGLARIVERLTEVGETGRPLILDLARDELVGSLLLLHGLHPEDLETRVLRALEGVRPRLGSHGGDLKFLGVTPDGAVRISLQGNCRGCPSSAETLRLSIEEAVYAAAPEVTEIRVEEAADPPGPGGPAPASRPVYLECPLPPAGSG